MELGVESGVEVESRVKWKVEWKVVAGLLEELNGKLTGKWRGKWSLERPASSVESPFSPPVLICAYAAYAWLSSASTRSGITPAEDINKLVSVSLSYRSALQGMLARSHLKHVEQVLAPCPLCAMLISKIWNLSVNVVISCYKVANVRHRSC